MLEHSFGLTSGMLTRDFGALTTAVYFVLLHSMQHMASPGSCKLRREQPGSCCTRNAHDAYGTPPPSRRAESRNPHVHDRETSTAVTVRLFLVGTQFTHKHTCTHFFRVKCSCFPGAPLQAEWCVSLPRSSGISPSCLADPG